MEKSDKNVKVAGKPYIMYECKNITTTDTPQNRQKLAEHLKQLDNSKNRGKWFI